jgi:hypothetical protein
MLQLNIETPKTWLSKKLINSILHKTCASSYSFLNNTTLLPDILSFNFQFYWEFIEISFHFRILKSKLKKRSRNNVEKWENLLSSFKLIHNNELQCRWVWSFKECVEMHEEISSNIHTYTYRHGIQMAKLFKWKWK